MRHGVGVHPAAVVGDRQHRVRAGADRGVQLRGVLFEHDVLRLEHQAPASRHGVTRVDSQVQHDLMHLPGISGDGPSPGSSFVISSMSSPSSRRSILMSSVIKAFRSRTLGCSSCRRLKASSWLVSSAARSPARLNLDDAGAPGSVVREIVEDEVRVPVDRRQEVVEVVRDASSKASNRFDLSAPAEAPLRDAPWRDRPPCRS
jgi:hypothetical protein